MTRRILVPIDGSAHSRAGLEHALSEYSDADITVLHVVDPIASVRGSPDLSDWELWYEDAKEEANAIFAEAHAVADEYGVDFSTATITGRPKHAIVEYTEEHDIDQIVMGSRGRTDDPTVQLGSVAETVVRRAPVLVTVVR